jgi:hypothetical protein
LALPQVSVLPLDRSKSAIVAVKRPRAFIHDLDPRWDVVRTVASIENFTSILDEMLPSDDIRRKAV